MCKIEAVYEVIEIIVNDDTLFKIKVLAKTMIGGGGSDSMVEPLGKLSRYFTHPH